MWGETLGFGSLAVGGRHTAHWARVRVRRGPSPPSTFDYGVKILKGKMESLREGKGKHPPPSPRFQKEPSFSLSHGGPAGFLAADEGLYLPARIGGASDCSVPAHWHEEEQKRQNRGGTAAEKKRVPLCIAFAVKKAWGEEGKALEEGRKRSTLRIRLRDW